MNASTSPVVQSQVIFDAAYSVEMLNRCRSMSIFALIWSLLRYPVSIFFLVVAAVAVAQGQIGIGIAFLVMVLAGFFVSRLGNEIVAYRIRNSAEVCKQVVEIGATGIRSLLQLEPPSTFFSTANLGELTTSWQDVSRAVVFRDGVLIYCNCNRVYWVPDSSLRTPDEAKLLRELVAAHSRMRAIL